MIVVGTFVFGILVGCFIERHRLGLTSWSYNPNCEPSAGCSVTCPPSRHRFSCASVRVPSRRWCRRRRSIPRPPPARVQPFDSELFIPRRHKPAPSRSRSGVVTWDPSVNYRASRRTLPPPRPYFLPRPGPSFVQTPVQVTDIGRPHVQDIRSRRTCRSGTCYRSPSHHRTRVMGPVASSHPSNVQIPAQVTNIPGQPIGIRPGKRWTEGMLYRKPVVGANVHGPTSDILITDK